MKVRSFIENLKVMDKIVRHLKISFMAEYGDGMIGMCNKMFEQASQKS